MSVEKRWPQTEADLARSVVSWLSDMHWDVYQEVEAGFGARRADIVARQGAVVWIIETKLSMSLDLIDQGFHWTRHAHYVSICYPHRQHLGQHRFRFELKPVVRRFLEFAGIGQLTAEEQHITETVRPWLNRRPVMDWLDGLTEEHKTFAEAGSARGHFWSPFQRTCQLVANYVEKNPGATLKEVVDNVDTHYSTPSSARSCIANWARAGKIDGVTARQELRHVRLFPCERKKPKVICS